MPVPVPTHNRPSAHRVIKAHSNFRDVVHSLVPEPFCDNSSEYVIQQSCQPGASQGGFYNHSLIQDTSSNWPSFAPFYSGNGSKPGLVREGSGVAHGLIAAGDAAVSNHVHAEACRSPGQEAVNHSANMGLQHFIEHRLIDVAATACELETTSSVSRIPARHFLRGDACTVYGDAFLSSHKQPDPDARGEVCDSLLQPATTPFADFVDRIVATEVTHGGERPVRDTSVSLPPIGAPCRQQEPPVTAEPLSNPSYIRTYRAMAEPLSEWMADFVWKVCTDGVSLPRRFVGVGSSRNYEEKPSSSLVKSIHSVLCSTLLQPSAIILALWYITRLPVLFEGQASGVNLTPSELEFRQELYGEGRPLSASGEWGHTETCAAFRIALLGCMLANKWLDDHTFSNKTWQSISDVPIQSINRLELAALTILGHDLSVTPKAWEMWLAQLHRFPVPICRPSVNDSHTVARKMITDLAQLHTHSGMESPSSYLTQPVFSALLVFDFDKRGELCHIGTFDPFEIDLDEDGPLREEYVPRRRSAAKIHDHTRSTSMETSDWSSRKDHNLCYGTRHSGTYAAPGPPAPEAISFGSTVPFVGTSTWGAPGGLDCTAASFAPQHADSSRSNQASYNFFAASAFSVPSVCAPTTHSRPSTNCAGPSSGHLRSYSQSYISGNDAYCFPPVSCSQYVGHSSTIFPGQGDVCQFRPLWLKT